MDFYLASLLAKAVDSSIFTEFMAVDIPKTIC